MQDFLWELQTFVRLWLFLSTAQLEMCLTYEGMSKLIWYWMQAGWGYRGEACVSLCLFIVMG